jgi:hypothetical protein
MSTIDWISHYFQITIFKDKNLSTSSSISHFNVIENLREFDENSTHFFQVIRLIWILDLSLNISEKLWKCKSFDIYHDK